MYDALLQLLLFSIKTFIIFIFIVSILIVFFALLFKSRGKTRGRLIIKNLNKKYNDNKISILSEISSKKALKKLLKQEKSKEKSKEKTDKKNKKIYVLNFIGDIRASAVSSLREEITAILTIATKHDEVVLCLESPGGIVPGYGLAAAQLQRLRSAQIPLTVIVDKVAASGGYLMACIADKIISAPFAIIGSIGVIVQLPNFHRLLKDKRIDFEQHTAGEFKRTITVFGENTESGREKLREEIEDVHQLFKKLITTYRPQINIQKVATGEHWYGEQALQLQLIDEIKTSDDYLLENSRKADLYEINYEVKKPMLSKLMGQATQYFSKVVGKLIF